MTTRERIIEAVESSPDGEISIDRLSKKIFKRKTVDRRVVAEADRSVSDGILERFVVRFGEVYVTPPIVWYRLAAL